MSGVSYCANVGQQGEDYDAIRKKATDCGASKVLLSHMMLGGRRVTRRYARLSIINLALGLFLFSVLGLLVLKHKHQGRSCDGKTLEEQPPSAT